MCSLTDGGLTNVGRCATLPARHHAGDDANIYLIEGDKTLLYAHDTGYFLEEVFAYIEEKGLRFDLVTLDCTNVEIPEPDTGGHMALDNIRRVVARLTELGAVDDRTVKVVNHFSHNGCPLQEELEEKVEDDGFLVAYDGRVVEF